jgi:hypothetical protein
MKQRKVGTGKLEKKLNKKEIDGFSNELFKSFVFTKKSLVQRFDSLFWNQQHNSQCTVWTINYVLSRSIPLELS